MTYALDQGKDAVWHPKSLYQDVLHNVGCVPAVSMVGASDPEVARDLLLPAWDNYCMWQADALDYLMDQYEVIFSHLHNVDAIGHQIWHFGKENNHWGAVPKYIRALWNIPINRPMIISANSCIVWMKDGQSLLHLTMA